MVTMVMLQFVPASANKPYEIKAPGDLANLARELKSTKDQDNHSIYFVNYNNVGSLTLDAPSASIDTLILTRSHSDSEAVIKVDSTFLTLSNMSAPVVLKGLAFELMKPTSVLIAGAQPNQVNRALILDSCFIYADTLAKSFLSWIADNNSSVEIRNSYIVVKGGASSTTRIALTAGTVLAANNLFNFPGAISATVTKRVDFASNTFNRTQLELTGKLFNLAQPTYGFSQNLFAHRPIGDAFSGTTNDRWVATISGFYDLGSTVSNNRVYLTWKGFAFPSNSQFDNNVSNRFSEPTADKKLPTELWDWYTDSTDPTTGLLTGNPKKSRYNVLPEPGVRSRKLGLGKDTLTVHFQPVTFPRNMVFTPSYVLPRLDSSLRPRFPVFGSIYLGPFKVDSITMDVKADRGKPVLLAQAENRDFAIQKSNAAAGASISSYINASPTARMFIIADSGNTPMGTSITPTGKSTSLGDSDRVIFAKVDSAGQTKIGEFVRSSFPNDYRYLNKRLRISTTASMNTKVTLGSTEGLSPWSKDTVSVKWLVFPDSQFVDAKKADSGPNRGLYMGTANYNSESGPLDAYLVEKLSAPKGRSLAIVGNDTVIAYAEKGYQLTIDSLAPPDTIRHGHVSRGYRFFWTGRGANDSLILVVKGPATQKGFVKLSENAGGKVDSVPVAPGANGTFRFKIGPQDDNKTFFLGVEYNVEAFKEPKDGFLDKASPPGVGQVNLTNFQSSTSGRLTFQEIPSGFLGSNTVLDNPKLRNVRLLGGKVLIMDNVTPSQIYSMSFGLLRTFTDAGKAEAWAFDGNKWDSLPNSTFLSTTFIGRNNIPPGTRIVLLVERLQEPANYVSAEPKIAGDSVFVTPAYINDSLKQVTGYCFQIRSVNTAGTVEPTACVQAKIGETTKFKIQENSVYTYRIQYFMGADTIPRAYQVLKGPAWNPKALLHPGLALKAGKRWHLLGFVGDGDFSKYLKIDGVPPDSTKIDTVVADVVMEGDSARFDTSHAMSKLQVSPGKAYLFASTRSFSLTMDALTGLSGAEPESVKVNKGWNFVANPFPMDMAKGRMTMVPSAPGPGKTPAPLFFGLTYDSAQEPSKRYRWDTVSALLPFEGYAFYALSPGNLVFDPFAAAPPAAEAKRAATGPVALRLRFDSPWGETRMALITGPRESDIPLLPPPGASARMRVGGRSGYLVKTVADLAAIDEPVEILSARAGRASFSLEPDGAASAAAPMQVRLVDLVSGRVYDQQAAADLPLVQGSRSYRLVAGTRAFVEERTQGLLAGAPREIGLSQNYPNPFRGKTKVALDWPAWQDGERRALLEVVDMQGRQAARMDMKDIRVGRQVVTLDASHWRPGVYLYRLTVVTGGRMARLQKRMLVTP